MVNIFRKTAGTGLLFLTALFLQNNIVGQEINFRELKSAQDWQKARDDAKIAGKDIFLDIYATWCGPCKMMDADVYTDSDVAEFYNENYINIKVDGESEYGSVLASRFRLTGYPTMYFITADERVIYEAVGFRAPEALTEAGRNVKESGKKYLELVDIYNTSTLTDAQNEEFFNLLSRFEQKELLVDLAGERIKTFTEEDILKTSNKSILLAAGGDILSFPVKTLMKNALTVKSAWGEEDFNTYLSEAFNSSMLSATETGDTALVEFIVNEFIPVFMMSFPERIPEAQLTTWKIYFTETNDWENYIRAVEKHYNSFENGNLKFLYFETYYIVENQLFDPVLLDKSNEWMERVIEVQADFETFFLAAIVNTYRENFDLTLKYMNLAEGVAVSQDEKDSLEELKIYIDEL